MKPLTIFLLFIVAMKAVKLYKKSSVKKTELPPAPIEENEFIGPDTL